ncbi:M4 family metallopeptidase [Pseudoduganella ginsengisoli]|uniref:M4 family peptidase n=1 Tax=Pseudoduganella ginsengisoli TaxID=1462440 RepID=A0A6L6Q4W7_9BURK|nr:M4 family metallopeptidase [Pseudoduganella ginsengisoli]MTW04182.1 M4 family peptidase [Pseudoduganella ginsengisoli]
MKLRKNLLALSIAAICVSATASPAMMAPPFAKSSAQESAALVQKLAAAHASTGLDSDHGYTLAVEHPGEAGTRITRFAHTYKGVRVLGSDSVVVSDARGNVVSASASDRRNGLGRGSANALAATRAFSVTPAVTAQAAIDAAVRATAANGVHRNAPSAELVIYPVVKQVRAPGKEAKQESLLNAADVEERVTGYELAWLVQTRMADGGKLVFRDTVISAANGATLAQWNALQTVAGTGHSLFSGDVPIQTTLANGAYKMLDSSRGTGGVYGGMAVTNAANSPISNPVPGAVYTNTTNVWGDGQPYTGGGTNSANGQTAAVDTLWGLMNTYDLLKNTQGWSSLDGFNTAVYAAVHVDTNYDNAFYDPSCKCMYLGDGANGRGLATLDVMGHELGHGVTGATSNLGYSGESGGLNESSSDIMGEMVEAYGKNGGTGSTIPATGNDWMIGKELQPTGAPLRWMWKPSKDGASRDAWSSTLNSLNPHYSSGPNNRMFYFLSQGSSASTSSEMYSPYLTQIPQAMTGIGNDKAFRIWFRAATTKFTSSTNYLDARNKMVQAATELYGAGSREAVAVSRAYAAINVGQDTGEGNGMLTISSQPQSVAVQLGATATFSVTATSGAAPYKYQWLRNGAAITGATQPTYSLTAQASDSGAVFAVKVTDSSPTPQTVQSNNAVLTVSTGPETMDLIKNGSFESGAQYWGGSANIIGSWSNEAAYDGTKYAYLGGNGATSTESLTQTVTIPANVTAATLSFALHIDSAETTTTTAYDKLVVTVKNSAGTVLGTLATYTNLNKATGYTVKSFNLLPYKGQTVTLSFVSTEDSSAQTSFVVDKVRLIIN